MPHPFFILPHLTEMYFFRAFYEPSDHGFFIMTAPRIYKLYKNDRHCQVIGIGKHSENLENTFTYNVSYAPLISPKGKFGRKPAKMHEEIKDGKP